MNFGQECYHYETRDFAREALAKIEGQDDMRKAEIALVSFIKGGIDDMYGVCLYEDDQLLEVRPLEGKSLHYAEDVVENWENGIIQL